MEYHHKFSVTASLQAVVDFHAAASSMAAITPPPVIVRIHQAPVRLKDGDEMVFTLWLGPLPIHWHARIENITGNSFDDRQISGPFAVWVHRHTFIKRDDGQIEVQDDIHYQLKRNPLWFLVGLAMSLNLPLLFAYRAWKTRRILLKPDRVSMSAN
jgi:ligand-binding SRPBCC domain-containing protein